MRKTLLLLLAAAAVVGCKKNTESTPQTRPGGEDAIAVGANLTMTKATLKDVFEPNSRIGMFEATFDANKQIIAFRADETSIPGSEVYNANLKYAFGIDVNSIWAPEADNKVLKWPYIDPSDKSQGTTPIYLVGYHPYQANSAVVSDAVQFAINKEQTAYESLRTSDLMWAATTGTFTDVDANNTVKFDQLVPGKTNTADIKAEGLTKEEHSSKAVQMKFHHMLTKLQFNVRFTKPEYKYNAVTATSESQENFENPVISKIQLTGPDFTVKGSLDLKTGVYTPTANVSGTSETIKWEPKNASGDADPKPYVDSDNNAITIKNIGSAAAATDYAYYCDLIAQPGDLSGNTNNYIEFYVTYDYTSVDGQTTEKRHQIYRFALGKENLDPKKSFKEFKRNDNFNFKAVIELNSDIINIEAVIAPWFDVQIDEIQPY